MVVEKGVGETRGRPIRADSDEPMTSAASEIDAALKSGPTPKKHEPPKILPKLDVPQGDAVVEEKTLQGDTHSQLHEEANVRSSVALKNINPELVFHRIVHRLDLGGFQHDPPRKDFSSDYAQKVQVFIAKREVSSLDEILSKEMDPVFLQRLLDDILDILDTVRVTMPPLTNSPPTGDPILECLAAAPSCYRRANAGLLAPILDHIP